MKNTFSWRALFRHMLLLATPLLTASAQVPTGACGTQPLCYETADFTATVANFRTSVTAQGYKLIDTTIRFQNKTNQPLLLGYVNNSGMATDDRGNRSVVWGPNGYRGIGLVAGTNFDPRFVVRPGSYADAQFELVLQGWPKVVGLTYDMNLSVAEINSYAGNQHTLGGEFPLHFQGLTNGAAGAAPAMAALPGMANAATAGPCGLTATQGAAGKASSTVSNAASTISSIGSIFGKKKAAQNANQVASAAAGCDPRVNAAASTAGMVAGATANTAPQQAQAATLTNVAQQQFAAPPADAQAAMNMAAVQPVADVTTPAAIAADAYNKAKQPKQPKNSRQQRVNSQQTAQAPQQIASATPQAITPAEGVQPTSEPWTPPADVPATPVGPIVAAKMPDVIGVHLGMDPKEAVAITKAHYPKNMLTPYDNNFGMFPMNIFQGAYINPANNFQDDFNFQTTLPPEKQQIWRVKRVTKGMHINRETLFAALRQKYGKESVATGNDPRTPVSSDQEITQLLWLFDEQGRHVPVPFSNAMVAFDCEANLPDGPGGGFLITEARGDQFHASGWCASSYVAVLAKIGHTEPIVETVYLEMTDLPLALRTAHATAAWYRKQSEKARQADLEKSKQAKPVF